MLLSGVRERHVRFAFSAARETLRSVEVLLHASHHAEQMPWIRNARKRLNPRLRAEIAHFKFFFSPGAEVFPMLPQGARSVTAAAGIDVLRKHPAAYREAVVRRLSGARLLSRSDIAQLDKPRWYRRAARDYGQRNPAMRPMLQEYVASPARSLQRFCDMLAQVQSTILEPGWADIHSRLLHDIKMRRALLQNYGLTA